MSGIAFVAGFIVGAATCILLYIIFGIDHSDGS